MDNNTLFTFVAGNKPEMKKFFTAMLMGSLSAVIGAFIIYLLLQNINLGCRDCQGAAGPLLVIFFTFILVFFFIGFFIAYWRMSRK